MLKHIYTEIRSAVFASVISSFIFKHSLPSIFMDICFVRISASSFVTIRQMNKRSFEVALIIRFVGLFISCTFATVCTFSSNHIMFKSILHVIRKSLGRQTHFLILKISRFQLFSSGQTKWRLL